MRWLRHPALYWLVSIGLGAVFVQAHQYRNLFLGGTYSLQRRDSTLPGSSYTQNVLLLRLGTQF